MHRILAAAAAATWFLVLLASVMAQEARQFLLAPFLCSAGSPPVFTPSDEQYLHEFRDYAVERREVCALIEQFQVLRTGPGPRQRTCRRVDLVRYSVMCQGGAVSAAAWYAASPAAQRAGFYLEGDTLFMPFKGGGGWQIGGPGISGLLPGRGSRAYVALPPGAGLSLNLPVRTAALDWSLRIPVNGTLPNDVPAPAAAAPWVQQLAALHPWPQLLLGAPLLLFGVIALIGQRTDAPPKSGITCLLALGVALAALTSTHVPASLPGTAHQEARAALARAREDLRLIAADQARVADLMTISPRTGMVEPLRLTSLQRAAELLRPRTVTPVRVHPVNPSLWAAALLAPGLAFVLLYALAFIRGFHYLFVPHPAAVVAAPALRTGDLFDAAAMGAALAPAPETLFAHPPAYRSRNLFTRARALREKIDADAEIADAAMRRDRARAMQLEAEAVLRAARKKLPWWQRWRWW